MSRLLSRRDKAAVTMVASPIGSATSDQVTMSTLDQTLDSPTESAVGVDTEAADRAHDRTIPVLEVLTTSDHKVIGTALIGVSLVGLLAVAVVALLLGVERIDGEGVLLNEGDLPHLFAAYRVGLVEAVVVPLLLGICVFTVPLQLGARSLAFPRAAAAGLWAWLAGVVLLVIALANSGGPGGGNGEMVELYLASNVLVFVGLTAVAATVATSVLTTRAPGMRLHRVPLFSWGALVASLGLVLVLPVAAGTYIYLLVDVRYGLGAFGGASPIDQWTSFLFSGPVLGLFALPAVGVVAELLPVTFRQRLPMRFVVLAALGLVATASFAGVAQQGVVTLPGTGSPVKLSNFGTKLGILANWGLLTLLPVLGVVIVMGIGALVAKPQKVRGELVRPNFNPPFLFGFLGLGLILLGMLGSAVSGIEDLALAGTVFEEGASVAVFYGALVIGLGAIAYWFPKASGRKLPNLPLYGLALLGAGGAALASAPYLLAGFLDQPAASGVWVNDGPGELLNIGVTAGHGLVALVVLAFAALAAKSWRDGDEAGDNPWLGHTLEWVTTSPAPPGNFETTSTVMSPEPVLDLTAKPDFAGEQPEEAG